MKIARVKSKKELSELGFMLNGDRLYNPRQVSDSGIELFRLDKIIEVFQNGDGSFSLANSGYTYYEEELDFNVTKLQKVLYV